MSGDSTPGYRVSRPTAPAAGSASALDQSGGPMRVEVTNGGSLLAGLSSIERAMQFLDWLRRNDLDTPRTRVIAFTDEGAVTVYPTKEDEGGPTA